MIRFSKREDYAVILIQALSEDYNKRIVPLSEIAKKNKISLLFLRNLALDLKNSGIIKAIEGKNGGYFLNNNPKKITIGDVLSAVNQKPILECCPTGKSHHGKCKKVSFCKTGHIWRQMNQEFLEKISKLTLDEFIHYQ